MTTALGFKIYPLRDELQKIGSMSTFGIGTRRPSGSAMSTASYGSSTTNHQPAAFSTLEDSGNVNNRGLLQQSSSQRDCFAVPQQQSGAERDSSTLVNTGSATGGTAASLQRMTSNGSINKQQQQQTSHSNNESCDAATAGSDAAGERIIEEQRKRANGDGCSIHRYTLGRLLGKGGFAKVYLCTAMDTGKNYAVKVVPKANLVKARARQKVRKDAHQFVSSLSIFILTPLSHTHIPLFC